MLTDGRTTDGRTTDAGVIGILIAHLGAFGSGELTKILITTGSLMKVKSIAECSTTWSILQKFRPALSDNWS